MTTIKYFVLVLSITFIGKVTLQNVTEISISSSQSTVSAEANVSSTEVTELVTELAILRSSINELLTQPVDTTTASVESTTASFEQKWLGMEKRFKTTVNDIIKIVLPNLMGRAGQANISKSCVTDIMKLIGGLRQLKPWAFSFFDASAKFIDGMLMGTLGNMGEYDQCIATEAIDGRRGKNHGKVMFRGKYCALDIKPPLPPKRPFYKLHEVLDELKNFSTRGSVISESAKVAQIYYLVPIRYGICIPSGCQESDIDEVLETVRNASGMSMKLKRCEVKEEKEFTKTIIAVMCGFSFIGFLVLVGTLTHLYFYYTGKKLKGMPLELLTAFSFLASFKKFVETENAGGNLSCFHGLRVLSITWIILGHTYLNINFQLFRGLKHVMDMPLDFAFQAVINATVAVDTFFFMGGCLVTYLTIKTMKDSRKPFNIFLYLAHRTVRIMPIYTMTVSFMFMAPIIGNGPAWHDSVTSFVDACYKNWWTNFLFINNFYHSHEICLPQSWYLACDMQLYIAALMVILPLIRWPKIGLSIAGFGVIASMIASGVITYVRNYPPTMLFIHPDHEQRIAFWGDSYFKPYSHAGPYCVGLLCGYLFASKPNLRLSIGVRLIGWSMAIACNMAVLYGVWEWNKGVDPTLFETLLYSSCHRVAWSLGVAWVVTNCFYGQGGIVNYILSWKCWVVLGRLTYGAYLIHPIVQITALGNIRMKLMPWHYFAVWMFFGHLAITYGIAFAACMLVEAPFLRIEKIFLDRIVGTTPREEPQKEQSPENGSIENSRPKSTYQNGKREPSHENGSHVSRL